MPDDLSFSLPRDTSAALIARRTIERHVDAALDDGHVEELKLLVSELVNNAVIHGEGAISLRLQIDDGIVRGDVVDGGDGFEREVRERGPDDVGGRGLIIVEALASRWGIHEGTTHVWFELDIHDHSGALTDPQLGEGERPDVLAPPEPPA